jgi:hypothetical protein
MMGIDSASSAQSKRGAGSSTDGGVGIGCRSGGSSNSSCKRAEREAWGSSWGSATTVGLGGVESGLDRCG